ncbi:hypothetical protein BJX66DRAFT_318203 [Aspergillus keveii]|uniref:DUF3500 domain-containing protein n=1 Tax=Aspergillus keveii TaxID=714993 RepID=A0ABR4FK20_9EURO
MSFRDYIPPKNTPRSIELRASNAYEWAANRCAEPFIKQWSDTWREKWKEPFKGVTTDGHVRTGLFTLASQDRDDGAPVDAMVQAANSLLQVVPESQREALRYPIEAPEWRSWMNPEIYMFHHGIRLEEVSDGVVKAIHEVLRASLSSQGYFKVRGCMEVNRFLGELVEGTKVMNEKSYNFLLFGEPSRTEPWGWQIYGHHLCMNCFVIRSQMVISPIFMGAEPNIIDEGPEKGLVLFSDQEDTAVALMQALDDDIRGKVCISAQLSGATVPSWRYHPADQRHVGGAFQDNRVMPYEGYLVAKMSTHQQDLTRRLLHLGLNYLPESVLVTRLEEISRHWDETYFCWIGSFGPNDAFYYKIHSPVVMMEFDHHSGVFLNNKTPLPFHIHTSVRTPNGNDYGKMLLRQYLDERHG